MFSPTAVTIGGLPSSTPSSVATRSTGSAWRLPLTLTAMLLTARATFWVPESPAASLFVPAPAPWSGMVAVERIHGRPILGLEADIPFTAQAWVERGDQRILVSEGMRLFAHDRLVTRGVTVDLVVPVCGEVAVPENTTVVPGRWTAMLPARELELGETAGAECPKPDELGRAVAVSDAGPAESGVPERMSALQGEALGMEAR